MTPRRAELAEREAVESVVAAAFGHYVERLERVPSAITRDYATAIASGVVWVLGEPIVGVVSLRPTEQGLLIENLAVQPEQQGRGLGRLLMAFAEQAARAEGRATLSLYTSDRMIESLEFYLALGYVELLRDGEGNRRRIYLEKRLDVEVDS